MNNLQQEIKKEIEQNDKELSDILLKFKQEYSPNDIISSLNYLYINNIIVKIRKNESIFFSKNNTKVISETTNNNDNNNNNLSNQHYHNISKLARKFRSCRYSVERNIDKNNIAFSLKLTKNENVYYIKYCYNIDFFSKDNIFDDILNIDKGIRIVTPDESTKLSICKIFDKYIDNKYGKNGYLLFKKKYSFNILTMEQFFKKTTWKTLLLNNL